MPLCDIYDDNLLAECHFRYMSKGGIAYHHVADTYVALFSTFMRCGLWEAVAILDDLLKNDSQIKPSIVHADTQGQSTVVFGLYARKNHGACPVDVALPESSWYDVRYEDKEARTLCLPM